jgi:hypothetical protein
MGPFRVYGALNVPQYCSVQPHSCEEPESLAKLHVCHRLVARTEHKIRTTGSDSEMAVIVNCDVEMAVIVNFRYSERYQHTTIRS